MNTESSTTNTPKAPKNPARGNQQGQTTFAAKIDRWEGMVNNLLPAIDQYPQLKPALDELQQRIAVAKVLRDRLRSMKADVKDFTAQRQDLIAEGEDLFSLLSLGLRFTFGPDNDKLAAFAVKPRKKTGRPNKMPPPPAPLPEAPTAPQPGPVTSGALAKTTTK